MGALKEYLGKNRDLLFTIGLVILLDHLLFEGAFREKLKKVVDGLLDRASNHGT